MCEWKSTDGSLEMKLFVGFWSGENNSFKPISIITNKSRCKSKSKIEITAFNHTILSVLRRGGRLNFIFKSVTSEVASLESSPT